MNKSKYIKALIVVSSLLFMSGFIAFRAGAFDTFLREEQPQVPPQAEPEESDPPKKHQFVGTKSMPLGSVPMTAPASAAPKAKPKSMMPGSKREEIFRPGDSNGGLPPQP